MPERLAPLPLIQVNAGFGIGGIRRETAGGNNGSGNPWEESPGTDWKDVVRGQVYGGPKKPRVDNQSIPSPDFPITCDEVGVVRDDANGRLRIYFELRGVDLSRARFMASGNHYLRPDGSDSAVFARLPSGILIFSTYRDIIDCQHRVLGFRSYTMSLGEFHCKQLSDYNPREMGVSVKGNLVIVGYPQP